MRTILAFLMFMGTAFAGDGLPTLPPKEYDKPYRGPLLVLKVPPRKTDMACREAMYMPNILGYIQACAFFNTENTCIILMPEKEDIYSDEYMERLFRHEIGHCNGWVHPTPLKGGGNVNK